MNSLHTDPIPNGTRFVALYGDGSWADLYMIDADGELIESDGEHLGFDHDYLFGSGFTHWLPLPETFRLWFEQKAGGE